MTVEISVKMNWHDYLQILEDTIQNVSDMQRMISSNNLQKNNLRRHLQQILQKKSGKTIDNFSKQYHREQQFAKHDLE